MMNECGMTILAFLILLAVFIGSIVFLLLLLRREQKAEEILRDIFASMVKDLSCSNFEEEEWKQQIHKYRKGVIEAIEALY
jgi:aromatic ring hydroxylase